MFNIIVAMCVTGAPNGVQCSVGYTVSSKQTMVACREEAGRYAEFVAFEVEKSPILHVTEHGSDCVRNNELPLKLKQIQAAAVKAGIKLTVVNIDETK